MGGLRGGEGDCRRLRRGERFADGCAACGEGAAALLGFEFFFDDEGEGHAELARGDLVGEDGGDTLAEVVALEGELGVTDEAFAADEVDFGWHGGIDRLVMRHG